MTFTPEKLNFSKKICGKCRKRPYNKWDVTEQFLFAYGLACHLVKEHREGEEHFVPAECPYYLEILMSQREKKSKHLRKSKVQNAKRGA